MLVKDAVALVTGANRGLGARLVEELSRRGAARIYATARRPETLASLVEGDSGRITPLALDIDDAASVAAAVAAAADVTLLVNNAGVLSFGGPLDAGNEAIERDMRTNYFGTLGVTRGFVPVIEANGGGAILNVLTVIGLAPMAGMAGYCASKAAAHSMTQALRAQLSSRGISVHGAYPAGIDTDMLAGVEAPKTPPAAVAAGILDGLEAAAEDIFPDPNSQAMAEIWLDDPKALEHQLARA